MSKFGALEALGAGGTRVCTSKTRAQQGIDPVSFSAELQRIIALPRRVRETDTAAVRAKVEKPTGELKLRPLQALSLAEALVYRGAFIPLAVGGGKTLIAATLPTVLDKGPTVVLTNAGLVRQANVELSKYASSFYVRRDVRWVSYGILSSHTQFEVLERLAPAIVIADECQALSNAGAARSKRFKRYLHDHPDVIFVGMSGSITRKSIKDYAHLLHFALKEHTPFPRDWKTLMEWAEAVDVSDRPRPPGALIELMTDAHAAEFLATGDPAAIKRGRQYLRGAAMRPPEWDSEECTELQRLARDCVRRRLNESLGVIASATNPQKSRLVLSVVPAPTDEAIEEAVRNVADTWARPDGELLTYGIEIARVLRHVREGGFYRWVWPASVVEDEKVVWLKLRAEYRKALREFLKHHSDTGIDSPKLVENALRGRASIELSPSQWRAITELHRVWTPWLDVAAKMREKLGTPLPPTEWVWLSKIVAEAAAEHALEHEPEIVWCDTKAVGHEIAKIAKRPWYGAGEEAQSGILNEDGGRSIIASIRAHGTGRNLQAFGRSLVVGGPSSGADWEQLLGRLHRPGQEAAEVLFEVYDSFLDELKSARRDANYIFESTGNEQKLLSAEVRGAW